MTDFQSRERVRSRQNARGLAESFAYERPEEASGVFKESWKDGKLSNVTWSSDSLVRVAMAGHLMSMDPENYSEYYQYLVEKSRARDFELAEAAMGGLGMASGKESIDLLIRYLSDARPGISDSAAEALAYRRVIIANSSIRSDERMYLERRIEEACAGRAMSRDLRAKLCGRGRN